MPLSLVTRVAALAIAAMITSAAAAPSAPAKSQTRWYWTERYTQAQISLTDASDLWGRQPAAILRGGYISDNVECTGLPPLLRRNGLRMYRRLDCAFRVSESNVLTGQDVDSYWSGIITPQGREDYLARWRRYA